MHICSYMHKEKMMLSESDLYNSNTAPDVKVNPKSLGAMWINYSNGRHYICSNNTMNKNIWLDPIGQLTNEFNSDIENLTNDTNNRFNTINSNINKLTTDTNNIINGINSKIDTTNGNINNITKYMNSNVNTINGKINEINARIDSNISKLEITETEITKITEKVNNVKSLGINQKWYNMGAASNVWYQNYRSSPITIAASIGIFTTPGDSGPSSLDIRLDVGEPNIDNNSIGTITNIIRYNSSFLTSNSYGYYFLFCIVPPTFYYRLYYNCGYINSWSELI